MNCRARDNLGVGGWGVREVLICLGCGGVGEYRRGVSGVYLSRGSCGDVSLESLCRRQVHTSVCMCVLVYKCTYFNHVLYSFYCCFGHIYLGHIISTPFALGVTAFSVLDTIFKVLGKISVSATR